MQSKWLRLGWLLLVLPIWWTFSKVDAESAWFSVIGYLLFGMAVWIWLWMDPPSQDKDVD